MAKSCNQKIKILYLLQLFQESTDEDNVISMQKILELLAQRGIRAERKSIYDDLETLRQFGMEIRFRKERPSGYYLVGNTAEKKPGESGFTAPVPPSPEVRAGSVAASRRQKADAGSQREEDQGEKKMLKLLCRQDSRKAVLKYFGEDTSWKEKSQGLASINVPVVPGPRFYGWLTSMGKSVQIAKPRKEAAAYRDYLKSIAKEYKGL